MKTSTTFSILIWINSSRAKNNEAEIFARVTVDKKRVNISLRKSNKLDNWDRAKGNGIQARVLNQYLDQVKGKLFQSYQNLRAERPKRN